MTDRGVDVAGFLEGRRRSILGSAEKAVDQARLAHYASEQAQTEQRLEALLQVVIDSCRARRLDAALSYADSVASQRRTGGVPLAELQTAINVLEEAVWRTIAAHADPGDQTYALGVVSAVLGAVKDRIACRYLYEVTHQPVHSLRVDLLFGGTEGPIGSG